MPITRHGVKMINATATGKTYNQHTSISWSYLNLGSVALNHTKKKQNIQVFKPKAKAGIFRYRSFKDSILVIKLGKLYPPKNNIAVKQLNNTIDEYSLKKKKTKGTDECSVKKPPTSSDSKFILFFSYNTYFYIVSLT